MKLKKWIAAGIAVLAVLSLAAAAVAFGPEALKQYRYGAAEEAAAEGRIDYAVELLLPELDRDPKNTELRVRLINMYIELGNYARAEYLLARGMAEQGGQTELYRMLCDVYVRQDKLLDAVTLLNNLPNPRVKAELDALRPDPPSLTPGPGSFDTPVSVEVSAGQNQVCYLTLDGEIPSTQSDLYGGPVPLPQGGSELRAVAVGPDGLVSDWASGLYLMDDAGAHAVFSEPAIEAQARLLLDMPEGNILSGDLQGIDLLIISEPHDYKTLDDLRWFTGLTCLRLEGQGSQADAGALAGLTQLKDLSLKNMGIDSMDLESIGKLENLDHLNLSSNQIATLGNLGALTGLTSLILAENNITDVTPLSEMVMLTELDLRQNGVEDTLPLVNLTRLTRLDMQNNRVRDVQGLSGMKALQSLNLSGNAIASVEPLAGLTALVGLSLSNNKELFHLDTPAEEDVQSGGEEGEETEGEAEAPPPYNSLTPLGKLVNLKTLLLDACGIEDVTPLAPLVKLERLSLNENRLSYLDGLNDMTEMLELSADRNTIKSLRPLQQMSKLKTLRIEYNGLPSLTAIKELPSLQSVYAFGNPLTEQVVFSAPNVKVYKG